MEHCEALMSGKPFGRNFEYLGNRDTAYDIGDHVTVTTHNGCPVNAVVKTVMLDHDTGDVTYKVQIQSGILKGPYFASESQLTPGWISTPDTCEGEGATASEINSEGVSSAINSSSLLLVIAGIAVLYGWDKLKNNTAHA